MLVLGLERGPDDARRGVVDEDVERPERLDLLRDLKARGLLETSVIVITGDHPATAAVVATELGIASERRAVTGTELEKMSDETLARTLREVSVYAGTGREARAHGDSFAGVGRRRAIERSRFELVSRRDRHRLIEDRLFELLELRARVEAEFVG